jgi:chromosome segregation ATPase
MPSHKEILQARVEIAERAVRDAGSEVERLGGQVKAEQKAIDELTAQYEAACRQVATGASGDPASILAQRSERSHRLRGLEALYQEASAAFTPLHNEHRAAQEAMVLQLGLEERERLEGVIADAQRNRDTAKTAFDVAEKALGNAVWARTHFLRQLELKTQGRA